MNSIFSYSDYREFLKDRFSDTKLRRSGFSHRAFARLAGFKASNFLLLVMQGKRNLSGQGIQQVAKALKLKKEESDFFENLVRFNQSKKTEEQSFYYGRLASNQHYSTSHPIEKESYEYYSSWYHSAVQELVLLEDFSEDPAWIAKRLQPRITPAEADSSLKLLMRLGFLVRDEKGRLRQRDAQLSTEDEVYHLAVAKYHKAMLELASQSIDDTPAPAREISSITFGVSSERMQEAKEMIQAFRKKLFHFLAVPGPVQTVYQFNVQLFNLSELPKSWPNSALLPPAIPKLKATKPPSDSDSD